MIEKNLYQAMASRRQSWWLNLVVAPGIGTGYLVFLEHGGFGVPSPAPSISAPNRGLVMWSFEADDIGVVYQRAKSFSAQILQVPKQPSLSNLPTMKSLILKDPEGFVIELLERV